MPPVPPPAQRPRFDVLVCDLDGTLVDTREGIVSTLQATLELCRREGLWLAVATSKTARIAREALEAAGLVDFFALVLGVDSVGQPKPAPNLVLVILAELGAAASRALVVGDTVHDVAMGRAAGARTCAVTYGAQSPVELAIAGPDFLVDSFGELTRILGLSALDGLAHPG